MCGRFTYRIGWDDLRAYLNEIIDALKQDASPEIAGQPDRYNIAPTQPVLAVRREGGSYVPQLMRWGLVPGWVKDPREFSLIINARSETMAEKPSFRTALKNQRCIIPASGYYEWQKQPDGSKIPFYITRTDGLPMLFAGLYATWAGPDGEEVDSACIVTMAAKGDMAKIHDRIPAILDNKSVADWLDTAQVNAAGADRLVKSLPGAPMRFHPVSTRVNSPNYDDESLIVPVYEDKPVTIEAEETPPKKAGGGQLDLF